MIPVYRSMRAQTYSRIGAVRLPAIVPIAYGKSVVFFWLHAT
jgi:hypothetical protein